MLFQVIFFANMQIFIPDPFLLHSLEIVNPDHFFQHLQIVVPDQFLQIVICDPFYLFLQIIFTKFANCGSRSFVNKLLFHIIFLKFYKLLFRIIFFTKSNGNISQILQRCHNYWRRTLKDGATQPVDLLKAEFCNIQFISIVRPLFVV